MGDKCLHMTKDWFFCDLMSVVIHYQSDVYSYSMFGYWKGLR